MYTIFGNSNFELGKEGHDVITKNNGNIWYLTLTSIKFDPDNQEI